MESTKLYVEAKEVLANTSEIISKLTDEEYSRKLGILSDSSIGEHTRHIIELFQQLLSNYDSAEVNYDARKRRIEIQENVGYALKSILDVIAELEKPNKVLQINSLVCGQNNPVESNYHRELLYNVEHCIHHQALIRVGLLLLEKDVRAESFGVAKSTLLYRDASA